MSAVDVLAVMDRADAHYAGWNISAADKAVLDDLNDARAAVAELIEAADERERLRGPYLASIPQTSEVCTSNERDAYMGAVARFAAALARCKGETK